MDGINAELLTPAGMADARALLISKHPWFLHAAPIAAFDQIQSEGLLPRNPGGTPQVSIRTALAVAHPDRIVCMRPIWTTDTTPRREPEFMLALPASAVPQTITLDWSFGGVLNLAAIIKADAPGMSSAAVFCEVAHRRGSIATYDEVPPQALRVWTVEAAPDPALWPALSETTKRDVVEVGVDVFGPRLV